MKKAVVLFSGGLDSTTCLALAKEQNFEVYALTLAYGQTNFLETRQAKIIAENFNVKEHKILPLSLDAWGGSALTDKDIAIPDYQGDGKIPVTYVPARNTIFLSLALGWAEVIGAGDIFIGVNFLDYSGYPDCRPDFLQAFEHVANVGTKAGIEGQKFKIHAPLLKLKKAEIIPIGQRLGVDYALTISCYRFDEQGRACGTCDCCVHRKKGFIEAGLPDPTLY